MVYSYKKLKTFKNEILKKGLKKASEEFKQDYEQDRPTSNPEDWKKTRFFRRFFHNPYE